MLKTILILLIIFICVVILTVLESIRENNKFNITEYKITDNKLPREFDGYKIVMMSDLHCASYGTDNELLIRAVKDISPDIIILAGDMIIGSTKRTEENLKSAEFIKKISKSADCYYGIGNHEKRLNADDEMHKEAWSAYMNAIKSDNDRGNIFILDNKKKEIIKDGAHINIYGLDLDENYYDRFSGEKPSVAELTQILGKNDKSEYNILIAHNPDFFDSYADWGFNLTFSGHVHGGLVRLPFLGGVISPKLRLFPKYDYGLFKKNNAIMILSNGLGSHSIKLRINNIPELVVVKLESGDGI
ncbi:MAG: metallophosphoesterase [Lachnospiraceae bacterium]|nr:metallophosphoesterase [Lachnospiraceae bacterium]MBQ9608760.1 metallophosphoesterase [Lachnospiraceae bacterium]